MMRNFYILLVLLISANLYAQELDCQVTVVSNPKLDVTSVELDIFKELEQTIYEFMNTTKWSNDEFELEERINCVLQVQINDVVGTGRYSASLQIQSTRPVLNSTYNTTLFSFLDEDFSFSYTRNGIINYSPNEYRNELTSTLAFFAHIIIGYDYDSFSPKGGQVYFEKAQNIVIQAQTSQGPGWVANDRNRNNRYWLIDYILQPKFEPLRECFYEYHRKGMDQMYSNKTEARKECYKAIQKLELVHRVRPGSMVVVNFSKMKLEEFKGIYSDADTKEKNDVVNLLKRIDPANSTRYQEILSE